MLRVAGIEKESIVDCHGLRYVIFTQGCHNVHTWDKNVGYDVKVEDLFEDIKKTPLLRGVTFSGGEPFEQAFELSYLAGYIKKWNPNLDIIAYTGYKVEELIEKSYENIPIRRLLCGVDIIVDGGYIEEEKDVNLKFRGGKNQRIINMKQSLDLGYIVESVM